MKAYLDIVKKVFNTGLIKDNRTNTATLAMPGVFFEHNMEEGFPLLTIRKMPIKSIAVELEGFIHGITSKNWYKKNGCNFWNHWANQKKVYKAYCNQTTLLSKQEIAEEMDDLGPLGYSYQMRRFGQVYDEDDGGLLQGYDQLEDIVHKLKSNHNDRRMVVSYWNPHQLNQMAIPPCTIAWTVTVIGGKLHLSWYQRSCDISLGLPSDIASNGMLLEILSKVSGFPAGYLTGLLVDCHIYENHIASVKQLLTRTPKILPRIEITNNNIFSWTHQDFILYNYHPWPVLNMGEIAI